MRVFRICLARRAPAAFDGEGARLYPGRWNERGIPLVYCASSLSLAALEVLVHVDPATVPDDLVSIEATLPPRVKVEQLAAADLPPDWRHYPAPATLQELGSAWARERRTVALLVPSAVIPSEQNVLLNPRHADFALLRTSAPLAFSFDPRLL